MTTNAPDSITMYTRHTVKELLRAVELRASPTTNHEHQPLNGHDLCRLMGSTAFALRVSRIRLHDSWSQVVGRRDDFCRPANEKLVIL